MSRPCLQRALQAHRGLSRRTPSDAYRIKAELVGFWRVNAGQPDLGGVDLDRIAVDDARDASPPTRP
jgi:hypothetical protein